VNAGRRIESPGAIPATMSCRKAFVRDMANRTTEGGQTRMA
jgi:hypothetical protein